MPYEDVVLKSTEDTLRALLRSAARAECEAAELSKVRRSGKCVVHTPFLRPASHRSDEERGGSSPLHQTSDIRSQREPQDQPLLKSREVALASFIVTSTQDLFSYLLRRNDGRHHASQTCWSS